MKTTIKTPNFEIPCITYYKDDMRTLPFSNPMIANCEYNITNKKVTNKIEFDLYDEQGYICSNEVSIKYWRYFLDIKDVPSEFLYAELIKRGFDPGFIKDFISK